MLLVIVTACCLTLLLLTIVTVVTVVVDIVVRCYLATLRSTFTLLDCLYCYVARCCVVTIGTDCCCWLLFTLLLPLPL